MDNCWISCQVMADMEKKSLQRSHNHQPLPAYKRNEIWWNILGKHNYTKRW